MVEFPDIREKEKRLVFYKNKELCFYMGDSIRIQGFAVVLCELCVCERYSILHEFFVFQ